MKRVLVLWLAIMLGLAVVGMAGPTVGWMVRTFDTPIQSASFVPFAVGIQYDGQYGFGVGVEVFKADLFEFDLYGTYGIDGFVTFDLGDYPFGLVGVEYLLNVRDAGEGTLLEGELFGIVGIGYGWHGHSLRIDLLYNRNEGFDYSAALRMDLLGLLRQVGDLFAPDEPAVELE